MELYPLLATCPQKLVHVDYVTIENPATGKDVNILVITGHFTRYAKAIVTSSHTAKVLALAFWHHFIVDYSFPEKLLMDQGSNFKSSLIKELCRLV